MLKWNQQNENAVKIELERRARADDPDEEARNPRVSTPL